MFISKLCQSWLTLMNYSCQVTDTGCINFHEKLLLLCVTNSFLSHLYCSTFVMETIVTGYKNGSYREALAMAERSLITTIIPFNMKLCYI